MISGINTFMHTYGLYVNFIAHTLIFMGTFYVALHNRNLPQWHVTPLWYAGLCSLFTSITILFEWTIGPEFPMSYRNLGLMAETLLNIAIASVAVIMLIGTVRQDIKNKKKRAMK